MERQLRGLPFCAWVVCVPVVCRGLIVGNLYEARATHSHLPSWLQLLDTIPLLEVMARTKKLDVLGDDGGSTPHTNPVGLPRIRLPARDANRMLLSGRSSLGA